MKTFAFPKWYTDVLKENFKLLNISNVKLNHIIDSLTINNKVSNHQSKLLQVSGYISAMADFTDLSKENAFKAHEIICEAMQKLNNEAKEN